MEPYFFSLRKAETIGFTRKCLCCEDECLTALLFEDLCPTCYKEIYGEVSSSLIEDQKKESYRRRGF